MPTTATGFLWEFPVYIRGLLSQSDQFQAWVGAANAEAALEYIHLYETLDTADIAQEKYAVVLPGEPLHLKRDAQATGIGAFTWQKSATYGLFGEVSDYSEENVKVFLNLCGAVLLDILNLETGNNVMEIAETPREQLPLRWEHGSLKGYQHALKLITRA